MKLKKLTSIITSTLLFASMFGNSFATAAPNEVTNNTIESISQQSDSNVLKVNIDDNGSLTYAEPKVTNDENTPFSWDNATVYFVLTDRFYNGDTSNDHSYGRSLNEDGSVQSGYKDNPGTFHGGDLKGLTKKLNDGYFTDLGVNAIWITAPYEQIHGYTFGNVFGNQGGKDGYGFPYYGYHGYWALDFTNMDANMGTAKDMEEFVDTAHSKGIRVVMDVVMNHLGYISAYDTNEYGFGKTVSNWKDYYYGDLSNLKGGDWEENNIYENDSKWASNWYGGDFVRIAYPFDGYNGSKSGDEKTMCLSGLPDIKMESSSTLSTPPFLVNKWKKEGRYDEEMQKQNAFFQKSGLPKTPQNYVVQWLTDWVREYGIDGFRCDTAKHIPVSSWKELKTQADIALKEWRENNPDKPGANWDENFWMTGEHWGHGLGKDYYFSNGFDSIINFTFPKSGFSTSTLEGTFSKYANDINSDPTYNVLSYISSHDDCLGGRDDLIGAANALLLTPGGAQIFYGDETGRKLGWTDFFINGNEYKDQTYRSDMNWDSIDQNVLSHWQKLGQFRNKHLSIGAGQHKKLSDSPYTFSRSYQGEDGVVDNVICVIGATGSTTVDVSSVFSDGDTITDYYTGNKAVVSGGKVTFTAGANGVILLESNSKKPAVNANPAGGDYYKKVSEGLEIKLTVGNADSGEYSINGGKKISYKNGDKITIGKGEEFGSKTTVELFASNDEGETSKTFTYTKKNPDDKFIEVHFKKSGWDSPNIYMYQGDGSTAVQLTGKWPGAAMEKESAPNSDWYTYRIQGETNARVIFNINGGATQEPGQEQPGYEASYEMWYTGSGLTSVCPSDYVKGGGDEELEVSLSGNKTSPVDEGQTIKLTATAKNGTEPYTYKFKANGKTLDSDGNVCNWKPSKGTYTVQVTVTDADGNSATSNSIEYVVEGDDNPLKIDSFTVSPNTANIGETVKLSASATGGSGTIKYKFYVKQGNSYIKIQDYSTSSSAKWTPSKSGNYTIYVQAKDDNEEIVSASKEFTVSNSVLKITSFTMDKSSPQNLGSTIKLNAKATGGSGTIKYKFYAKQGNTYTKIQDYSTSSSAKWTPSKSGNYTIYVQVKDDNGKVVSASKGFTINNSVLKITSFTIDKTSPQNLGSTITLNAKATGGSGTIKYKFYVKQGNTYTKIQDYSTSSSAKWTPGKSGNYTIYVQVKDNSNKVITESKKFNIKLNGVVITSLKTSKQSPQQSGSNIKITASAEANTDISYKFWVYTPSGNWTMLKDYGPTNSVDWKANESGEYIIFVDVKDSYGNKATKSINYTILPKTTRIEENNSKIKYTGSWTTASESNSSGKNVKYTNVLNSSLKFNFTGTGIKIIAPTSADKGIAEVTIDGTTYNVDMYSLSYKSQNVVFEKKNLKKGTHTISVKYTGMKNASSNGKLISIDAFDIMDGDIL